MIDLIATLRSYTATLLVALWVVQPLVGVLHSREHAHRFCPEHQTFEETARGSGQLQASRSSDSVPLLSAVRVDTGVDSVRGTHETCPVLSAGTSGVTQPPEAVAIVTTHLATSIVATAPPRSLSSLPILATSPKSSPPVLA